MHGLPLYICTVKTITMCSNYQPARAADHHLFGYSPPTFEYEPQTYPAGLAPFLANGASPAWRLGTFGLMPFWAKPDLARRTYNARTETVGTLASFRSAWKHRQLAIIPVQAFFEPNYESGKPVRWRIERADGKPFALAGIWERRRGEDGAEAHSFSMLTINADNHPMMRRFHAPAKEKRSVVVLDDDSFDAGLQVEEEDELRGFLRSFDPESMRAEADPRR